MSVTAEIDLSWYDPNVPVDWSSVVGDAELQFPRTTVWTVNLRVNNPGSALLCIEPGYLAYLYAPPPGKFTGATVQTNTMVELQTICESMDLETFPFDTQHCNIELMYTDSYYEQVNFSFSNADLASGLYDQPGCDEWKLDNVSFAYFDEFIAQNGAHYGFILSFTLSRNGYYYVITLITPTVVLQAASALTFLLPTDRGEKVVLGATLITAVFVLQDNVNKMLPQAQQSDTPHLVVALQVGFILAAVSLVEGVILQTLRIIAPELPNRANCLCGGTCGQEIDQTSPWQPLKVDDSSTKVLVSLAASSSVLDPYNSPMYPTLREIVRVMERQIEIRTRNTIRSNNKEAMDRSWRYIEYIINFAALLTYAVIVAYYFGISIYAR